jgi:uncharacterized protein YjiS (DUF1127 family)
MTLGEEIEMQLRALPAGRNRIAARLGRMIQDLATMTFARLLFWHELARQRRALLALNDRMLKDIGISRAEAEHEANRAFWSDRLDA